MNAKTNGTIPSEDELRAEFVRQHKGRNLKQHYPRGTYVSANIAALWNQHKRTVEWLIQYAAYLPKQEPDDFAVRFIEKRAEKYAEENASTDPDDGSTIWHYGNDGRDYHNTLVELAEDIRAAMAEARKENERPIDRLRRNDPEFVAHLERTSRMVETWPSWKRNSAETSVQDSKPPSADDEVLALHRQLATERLRADQGWARAEAKSKECADLRERLSITSEAELDAARYEILRAHVSPKDVRIFMTTIPPEGQTLEERIDMLCDIILEARRANR